MAESAREVDGVKNVRRSDSNPINNYKIIRSAYYPIANGLDASAWSISLLIETNCAAAGIPIF